MWTSYPPRYQELWRPNAAEWCAAWDVPVTDGNAALWIATYHGKTWSPSVSGWVPAGDGDTLTHPDEREDGAVAIAFAPSPFNGGGGMEGVVWREVSVSVTNLQPLGANQCAYILGSCTVGAVATPPVWRGDPDIIWSRVRAWYRRAA